MTRPNQVRVGLISAVAVTVAACGAGPTDPTALRPPHLPRETLRPGPTSGGPVLHVELRLGTRAQLASTTVPGAPRLPDVPGQQYLEHRHIQASGRPAQRRLDAQHELVAPVTAPGLRALRRLPVRDPVHGRRRQAPAGQGLLPVRERERPRPLSVRA